MRTVTGNVFCGSEVESVRCRVVKCNRKNVWRDLCLKTKTLHYLKQMNEPDGVFGLKGEFLIVSDL